jgi:hypothetical protein
MYSIWTVRIINRDGHDEQDRRDNVERDVAWELTGRILEASFEVMSDERTGRRILRSYPVNPVYPCSSSYDGSGLCDEIKAGTLGTQRDRVTPEITV